MKRATLYAIAWLAFTVGILIFHVGCGSATKPSAAKPEPKQTDALPLVCLQVERADHAPVVICGSAELCAHVHARLVAFWEPLSVRYKTTGLSDCTPVTAEFSER